MVDPISLMLAERVADHPIELTGRSEIASERFFNNHACPTSFLSFIQACGLKVFQDRLELIGRDCEIKKPVAARSAFLVDLIEALRQTFEAGFIAKVALMIEN